MPWKVHLLVQDTYDSYLVEGENTVKKHVFATRIAAQTRPTFIIGPADLRFIRKRPALREEHPQIVFRLLF